MIIDDKTIIQAIRGRTEVGFKLLMQKYKAAYILAHSPFGCFAR